MTGNIQFGDRPDGNDEMELRKAAGEGAEADAGLDQALNHFRSSVHAWSEAAYSRSRRADISIRRRSWRLAAGWALGCALLAGGFAGGIIEEHQQRQEAEARVPAAEQQARQHQAAAAEEQPQNQDLSLMAKVDSDTAQEVPNAMEPLAELMEDAGNR